MTGLRPLRWAAKLGILFRAWDQGSSRKSVTIDYCRLQEKSKRTFSQQKRFRFRHNGIKAKTVNVMTYWGKFIIEAMQACSILLAAEGWTGQGTDQYHYRSWMSRASRECYNDAIHISYVWWLYSQLLLLRASPLWEILRIEAGQLLGSFANIVLWEIGFS